MAIVLSEIRAPSRFASTTSLHFDIGNNQHAVHLSGIALVDKICGRKEGWAKDRLELQLKFPMTVPRGKKFKIRQAAPLVTLNSIYNESTAVNAGWAIDEFNMASYEVTDRVRIRAEIAIRDQDGWLYRVGYSVWLTGEIIG